MQPRVRHLFKELGRDPRRTPASNVVFARTSREVDLQQEKASLLAACWPVHAAVIEGLGVKAILCFGGTAGTWVREALGAHDLAGTFVEENKRRWTSRAHRNGAGQCVLTLTHPSIANWRDPRTDPTGLVKEALKPRA
jgi:uracil-DNA glycosylase